MITPIFVLGVQRSGTTWLANMLCNHPQIAGVQAKEHYGIHESAYFSHIDGYFGDLIDDNNFVQFVEVFGSSDYYKLTGLSKDKLYQCRPQSYDAAFRMIMDTYAENQCAAYWIEKTPAHTLYTHKLARYYGDAMFVAVHRDVVDVVRSFVKKHPRKSKPKKLMYLLRLVVHYEKYRKFLTHFQKANPERILVVHYEGLLNHPHESLRQICDYLGADYDENMMAQRYTKNSSFANEADKEAVLSRGERRLVKFGHYLMSLLPFPFFWALQKASDRLNAKRLPSWFWRMHLQAFEAESGDTNDKA